MSNAYAHIPHKFRTPSRAEFPADDPRPKYYTAVAGNPRTGHYQPVRQVPWAGSLRRDRAGRGQEQGGNGSAHLEQYATDVVYRFLPREQLYVGGRYNTASGKLRGVADEVSVGRSALAAGWFITPGILAKGVYVTQTYNDFPAIDIRHGGKFNGFVMEGVVSF